MKQADAPPLPQPGKGAGPTGAMLRPRANDIEMGVRPPAGNGVGYGAAAPPPVRPSHRLVSQTAVKPFEYLSVIKRKVLPGFSAVADANAPQQSPCVKDGSQTHVQSLGLIERKALLGFDEPEVSLQVMDPDLRANPQNKFKFPSFVKTSRDHAAQPLSQQTAYRSNADEIANKYRK